MERFGSSFERGSANEDCSLQEKLDAIRVELRKKLKDKRTVEEIREHDRALAEKIYELAEGKVERLNLFEPLSLWINELFQGRLLSKKEAEFLLAELKDSRGLDNYTTFSLVKLLSDWDLFQREKQVDRDFPRE
jgi:hypothetical protein